MAGPWRVEVRKRRKGTIETDPHGWLANPPEVRGEWQIVDEAHAGEWPRPDAVKLEQDYRRAQAWRGRFPYLHGDD